MYGINDFPVSNGMTEFDDFTVTFSNIEIILIVLISFNLKKLCIKHNF